MVLDGKILDTVIEIFLKENMRRNTNKCKAIYYIISAINEIERADEGSGFYGTHR